MDYAFIWTSPSQTFCFVKALIVCFVFQAVADILQSGHMRSFFYILLVFVFPLCILWLNVVQVTLKCAAMWWMVVVLLPPFRYFEFGPLAFVSSLDVQLSICLVIHLQRLVVVEPISFCVTLTRKRHARFLTKYLTMTPYWGLQTSKQVLDLFWTNLKIWHFCRWDM